MTKLAISLKLAKLAATEKAKEYGHAPMAGTMPDGAIRDADKALRSGDRAAMQAALEALRNL